jgi:hypothetical protein
MNEEEREKMRRILDEIVAEAALRNRTNTPTEEGVEEGNMARKLTQFNIQQ